MTSKCHRNIVHCYSFGIADQGLNELASCQVYETYLTTETGIVTPFYFLLVNGITVSHDIVQPLWFIFLESVAQLLLEPSKS